ncbi:MAG TPA: FHA domain-containing protein [Ktedonobacterales bacterium]|nr:FHA domain-containing protein [Ktedonobacterales bacterium]
MSIRCSQGHVNPDNAIFCDDCGEPLSPAQATVSEDEPTFPAPPAPPSSFDTTVQAANPPTFEGDVTQIAPEAPAAADEEATIPAPSPAAAPSAPPAAPDEEATVAAPSAPVPTPAPAPEVAPTPAPVVAPPPAPVAAPAQPHLIVEASGATFDLAGKAVVVIGREDVPSNSFPDWDLTPYGAEDGGVSRLHAKLTASGDVWSIEDLESTNFTFINRKRIPAKTPTPLNDGDEIRLGRVGLLFKTTA